MNFFFFLNLALGSTLTVLLIYVLICYPAEHILLERIGLGVAASAAFLSVVKMFLPQIFAGGTNDLYQVLWRGGWLVVIGGRVFRHYRHWKGNKLQARIGADGFHRRAMENATVDGGRPAERVIHTLLPPEPPRTVAQKIWSWLVRLDD